MRHFEALRRLYPADLARSALEIAILRCEAASKFPFADKLYLTRPALEQASSYPVSSYRAERFKGFDRLLDLGCSIGGDTLSLAAIAPTIGIEIDPLRLTMAQANLLACGLAEQSLLLQGDLAQPLPVAPGEGLALFFDPGRRKGEKRLFHVSDYQPSLSVIERWLPIYPALGVKVSPGVSLAELRRYQAEIEFISVGGELKEAVLWFGPLATARRRATLLPGRHSLADSQEDTYREPTTATNPPRGFLYEPDPAVLRAGLVRHLAATLEAAQLDPKIAYLTADDRRETPFARAWKVEEWLPFNLKRLRQVLRQRGVGKVTVKKRGSPLQPEELIHMLRLGAGQDSRDEERVLFLTHLRGEPIVVICFV